MMHRDEAIRRIKAALKQRGDRPWSVRAGRGTSWGWLTIDAPPRRRIWNDVLRPGASGDSRADFDEHCGMAPGAGHMGPDDRDALARLLGLENVHRQGVLVAPESYAEFVARAEGAMQEA